MDTPSQTNISKFFNFQCTFSHLTLHLENFKVGQVVHELSREGIKIIWKTVGKSSSNSSGMKTLQSEIYHVLATQKVYSKGILTSSNL